MGSLSFLFAALRAPIPTGMGNLCAEHMELSSKMVPFVKIHLVLFYFLLLGGSSVPCAGVW